MARKMLVDGEVDKATAEEANYDFDLFVIGDGSGGVRAARFSANHGAKNQAGSFISIGVSSIKSFSWQKNKRDIILLMLTSGRDPGIIPRNSHPPELEVLDGNTGSGTRKQ